MRTLPLLLLAAACLGCTIEEVPPPATPQPRDSGRQAVSTGIEKVVARHLPNVVRVHERVLSGGLPEGDEAFAELAALGVKTVLSVDGARPDVETAAKHGLRYVHLPHGYDGIPNERALELAKAVRELPGTVYIHCHHGKHRSPAAAAVACVGAGLVADDAALAVLETAGTSPHYRGLYQTAAAARKADPATLDALATEFPERAILPAMAESMVAIQRTLDHLQQLAKNAWQPLAAKPDLDAAHEALLLREYFTELLRTEEAELQPEKFLEMLRASEATARELEISLQRAGAEAPAEASIRLARISSNCTACHQQFRDVPLSEKRR